MVQSGLCLPAILLRSLSPRPAFAPRGQERHIRTIPHGVVLSLPTLPGNLAACGADETRTVAWGVGR